MFETTVGPVKETGATIYLRPETAQGIFVNFKNVLQFARKKLPFGIAQVGKSFRNEITPGNFIFRTREFEQMEMEFFVPPDEAQQLVRATGCEERMDWYARARHPADHLRLRAHDADELAHYSTGRATSSTSSRSAGRSSRGSPTAATSTSASTPSTRGEKLEYFDHGQRGERYVPHVIEPAAGADRAMLGRSCATPTTRRRSTASTRTVLRLHPRLAPIKVAVLPLVRKDGQPELRARGLSTRCAADAGRVRRGRLDRQALPPPGRDRHAVRASRSTTRRSRTARSPSATATRSRRSAWPSTSSRPCSPRASPPPGARRSSRKPEPPPWPSPRAPPRCRRSSSSWRASRSPGRPTSTADWASRSARAWTPRPSTTASASWPCSW